MKKLLLLGLFLATIPLHATDYYGVTYTFGGRSLDGRRLIYQKPTQAYYGKGYQVYYGYTSVSRSYYDAPRYVFGYPYQDFNQKAPTLTIPYGIGSYATFVFNPAHAGTVKHPPLADSHQH